MKQVDKPTSQSKWLLLKAVTSTRVISVHIAAKKGQLAPEFSILSATVGSN